MYRVAVCRFPGNNSEHPASSGWVMKTLLEMSKDERISEIIPLRASDTPVDMVRNLMVKTARTKNADYILMIDSDMDPDSEPDGLPFWSTSWDFMMQRRKDEKAYRVVLRGLEVEQALHEGREFPSTGVLSERHEEEMFGSFPYATVAAPYCCAPPSERPMMMRFTQPESDTHEPCFRLEMFNREETFRYSGIWEVAALPTGLILYDARVFDRLPPPWFAYEWADPPYNTRKATTEDIYQTRNASNLGLPQYANWDAWAGHIKPRCIRKPRPLTVDVIPDHLADAVRKGLRGDHKVKVIGAGESRTGVKLPCV